MTFTNRQRNKVPSKHIPQYKFVLEIFYHNSFWQQINFSPIRFLLVLPPHKKEYGRFCQFLLPFIVFFCLHPCIPIAGLGASEEKNPKFHKVKFCLELEFSHIDKQN